MAKQLNVVNLKFTADTTQAKQQLQELQSQLSKLTMTGTGPKLNFTSEIQEATKAAAQLEVQLKNATNVNTGKLDLGKFNEAMIKSGMSLSKYQNQLRNLGPDGDKAFAQLALSITKAEIPLKRSNALITEMWTTLKNTARWQISSSALHAFMGTLQSAYGYAKDLDESLNNIRIVTNKSTDEMAKFAKEANKAAKALSATTTDYTNASLIFYQQGLSGSEVEARTAATIKLANVARISAEEASDQLTAIWNNFDDGTQSLEHYADVMVKLGAETASSSDEIAQGLQKFAAIGKTVGLSYESAAAALATVTANTRESADVVGTAFKTIFARIEGLNLGETLDDGTTLNKYSEGLAKVGISIKDQYGELKDMDTILAEMGAKWGTLNKDQQVALAQTVAGVRQYNQLMALMNNWGDYQANLSSAQNADGALNNQAAIYAESWEASRDRVTAAAEAIYDALIDEDFFIGLNDAFAGFLGIIEKTIDGLGGIKGVLLTLGTILTQVFKKQIAESLANIAYSIKMSTESGKQSYIELKKEANKKLVQSNINEDTTSSKSRANAYTAMGNDQIEYLNNADKLSQEENEIAQRLMDRNRLMGELVIKSGENLELAEEESDELLRQLQLHDKLTGKKGEKAREHGRTMGNVRQVDNAMFSQAKKINFSGDAKSQQKNLKELANTMQTLEKGYIDLGTTVQSAVGEKAGKAFDKLKTAMKINAQTGAVEGDIKQIEKAWKNWTKEVGICERDFDKFFDKLQANSNMTEEELEELKQKMLGLGQAEGNLANQTGKLSQMGDGLKKFFAGAKGESMAMSTALTQTASTIMSAGMAISSISSLIDIWSDKNASLKDQLLATATSLGTLVPTIISVVKGFKGAAQSITIFGVQTSLAMWQVTLIVAAVAALIGLFAFLFKTAQDNTLEHQLEKDRQAAEALKDSLDETKTKVDNLFSAFDEYDKAVEALNSCVQGTEEWNEALKKANSTVLSLIEEYPELAKYENLYHRNDETGLLELDAGVVDQVKADAQKQLDTMQVASVMSNARLTRRQTEIETRDFKNDVGSYGAGQQHTVHGEGGYSYTYYDDYVNAGQIMAEHAAELANLSPEEYEAEVRELLQGVASDSNMTSAQFEAMVGELVGYQDSVNDLATATDEAANQINNAALAIANQILGDQGYDAATVQAAANYQQDQYDDIYNDIISKDASNNYQALNTSDTAEDIAKRYEKATGEKLEWSDNMIQGNDQNRVYAYKGKNGEETLSIEYMAQIIAAYESTNKMESEAGKIDEKLNSISDRTGSEATEEGWKDWVTSKSFSGMNAGDFAAMQNQMGELNEENVEAYLDKLLGDGEDGTISNESAKKYGNYDNKDDMVAAVMQSMKDYDAAEEKIQSSMGDEAKNAFGALDTSELSLEGQQAIANFLQKTFEEGGAEGLEQAKAILESSSQAEAVALAKKYAAGFNKEQYEKEITTQFNAQAEELDIDLEEFESYKKLLLDINEEYADNVKGLNQVALANKRMEKGVKALGSKWSEYDRIMSDSNASLEDVSSVMPGIKAGLQDVLNLDTTQFEMLPETFAKDNWGLIQDVMNGVEGSLDELRNAAGESILMEVVGVSDMSQVDEDLVKLNENLLNFDSRSFKVGVGIDDTEFIANCNNIIAKAGMTAEEAQAYFAAMGYDANIKEITVNDTVQREVEYPIIDERTGYPTGEKGTMTLTEVTGTTGYAIETITPNGTYGGGLGVSTEAPKEATSNKSSGPKAKKAVKAEEKQKKQVSDEAERYHEIKNELESVGRELDKVSKAKDRAFGKDKLKLMEQEAEVLKDQISLQEQYLKEIDANVTKDKNALKKYGASINDNGNITNYDEMVQSQVDAYNTAYQAYVDAQNAAINTWNGSNRDEAADEAYDAAIEAAEKAWEAAQDKYDEFQDDVSQYEDSVDLFEESKASLTDMQNQLYDLALEKVQFVVELKVNVAEDSLEYINYLLNKLDDGAYDAAESIALLGKSAQESFSKIEAYKKGLAGIFENHGLSEDDIEKFMSGDQTTLNTIAGMSFTEDEMSAMREYRSAILAENETLMQLRDTVHEKVLTAFQDLTSEMDNEINKIDQLKSVTQSYQNIIDVVGQEYLGITDELMQQIDQATVDMSMDKLAASQKKLEAMQESRKKVEAELQAARESGSEETVKKWEENLKEIDSMIQDAETEFMGSWEEAVQAAADVFEKQTARVVENFTDAMAGAAGSMEKLQDQFDKQKAASERYLADYKQSYELAKLARDISGAIDDTDNLKAKQEYKELIEEIEQIEAEGRKMSEYELTNLQKRYELKQAELALEEAKNSKSQVRMTRDNEGNWGYVYTADEDKVSKALQDYEDKAYAIQEAADQYSQEMQAGAIEVAQKIADEIQNIQATYGSEEWFAEVQRITAYYSEEFDYYADQLDLALGDLGISFADTTYGMVSGFNSMDEAQRLLNESIGAPGKSGTLLGDLDTAYSTWQSNVETAMNLAGTSTETFGNKVETTTNTVVDKSAEVREAINTMSDDMSTIMGDIVASVADWEQAYGADIDKMIAKNDQLISSYNALLAKQSEVTGNGSSNTSNNTSDSNTSGDSSTGGGDGGTGGGDGSGGSGSGRAEGVAAAIWMDGSETSGWGTGATRQARLAEKGVSDAQTYINNHKNSIYANWKNKRAQLKNFYYGSFDTGGYTGEWGPEGRLAMLHQKEIVLNAQDTKNLLDTVGMVRDIAQVIDLNAFSASQGLSSLLGVGTIKHGGEILQQEVTIHAEFPNATNHSEIEEAFNNLVNTASQYANRKF